MEDNQIQNNSKEVEIDHSESGDSIIVRAEPDSEVSLPSDFSEHKYTVPYIAASDQAFLINKILVWLLLALLAWLVGSVLYKHGLAYLLDLKRLGGLAMVTAMFGGIIWWIRKILYTETVCEVTMEKEGIEFSKIWNLEMLGRRFRSWDDIHSIQLEENVNDIRWRSVLLLGDRPNAEQINWTKKNKLDTNLMLQFDFKSGGNASIALSYLTRDQCRCVFLAIENFLDQSKLSQEAIKLKHAIVTETTNESYTDIWMEDLEQRYATTNFVPLPTGHKLLNDSYHIVSILSTRGQTAVYLARNKEGGNVVVKEMNSTFATSNDAIEKGRELFEREAAILAKLSHPNIAKVIDHFVQEKRVYLILEYIPGLTLRQLVKQKGPRACQQVIPWVEELLITIEYLHELEPPIIHRDISPDNIVIRKDGTVALIDFGAANEFLSNVTGTMVGKQSYISPEQFRGKAEPASDIYSLGATVYYLLTGEDPVPLSQSKLPTTDSNNLNKINKFVSDCTSYDTADRIKSVSEAQVLLTECSPSSLD